MKKLVFFICLATTGSLIYSQPASQSYQDIKKSGDSLYKAKEYLQAARTYLNVFKLSGQKFTIWDYHDPAFSYALTEKADSAFYFLDQIRHLDSVRSTDYVDVADDRDFSSIRNDHRWKEFNDKAFAKARHTFYHRMNNLGTVANLQERRGLAVAFAFNNQPDSVFYHLDHYAGSDSLNFTLINAALKNTYFKSLHSDSRWQALKTKMYTNVAGRTTNEITRSGENATNSKRREAAIAWINSGRPDSAFYQLEQIANSKSLTFQDVYLIITDGEFSNVPITSEFEPLENDPRWNIIRDKFFKNLHDKYIGNNSFARTKKSNKKLLIDGGHFNLHDIEGTYAPLAGTLKYSGIIATGLKERFNQSRLDDIDILVISNPNPDREDSIARRAQRAGEPVRWSAAATSPGYTKEEVNAIHDWVKSGGSFFLILDHAPFGKVGEALAAAFGIENRNVGTYDSLNKDPAVDRTQATTILFTRSKGLIGNHPIVDGIERITTYTGESLVGPPGSSVLLQLPPTARDQDWLPETKQFRFRSAEGRAQAVAFEYGKGRVVMLGEAAVTRPNSLDRTDSGNGQFVLNIFRWLAREI